MLTQMKSRIKRIKIARRIYRKLVRPTTTATPSEVVDPKDYTSLLGLNSIVPCQIEAYFLALNSYIEEKAKTLDVGFGLGYGLNIAAIKASEVSGVDVDQQAYEYCKVTVLNRNPRLKTLMVYNGYDLDFPDNYFDVVTCVDVIEHVEDFHKLIDEMLRVSKKGIFLSTPNKRPEYTNPDGTPKNIWHLREWTFEEFDGIIQKHGEVEWNFLNGPWEGPFEISHNLKDNSLTLSPFIYKNKVES